MLKEKGWAFLKFSDEMVRKVHELKKGLPKIEIPEDEKSKKKILGWLRHTSFDCGLSFFMVFITTMPAVILTIEVLRPRHLAPSGLRLAEDSGCLAYRDFRSLGRYSMVVRFILRLLGYLLRTS
jgi:hypothetical protein